MRELIDKYDRAAADENVDETVEAQFAINDLAREMVADIPSLNEDGGDHSESQFVLLRKDTIKGIRSLLRYLVNCANSGDEGGSLRTMYEDVRIHTRDVP
jgi:hypothetical protein